MRELPATLVQRLGGMPATALATWAAVTCALVAVPVVLSLARESRFVASIEVMPADPETSHSGLATSVRQLLEQLKAPSEPPRAPAKPLSEQEVRDIIDEAALADRAAVAPTMHGVVVSVWGGTPTEAARLGNVLAEELEKATARAADERIVLGTRRVSDTTGFVDRMVDGLPGPISSRPDPVWAGLAGLVVAVAFMGMAFLWREPGLLSRSSERPAQRRGENSIESKSR